MEVEAVAQRVQQAQVEAAALGAVVVAVAEAASLARAHPQSPIHKDSVQEMVKSSLHGRGQVVPHPLESRSQ